MSDAQYAVFDKSGKYIYFTASTNIGPTVAGLDMSSDGKQVTRNVYVIVLRKDLPSPLAPESDEEKTDSDKKDTDNSKDASKDESDKDNKKDAEKDKEKDKSKDKEKSKEPVKVSIDFDNISQRILALPLPAKDYVGLFAGKAGEFLILELPPAPDSEGPPSLVLSKFDLAKRKADQLIAGNPERSGFLQRRKISLSAGRKVVHRGHCSAGQARRRRTEDGCDGSLG